MLLCNIGVKSDGFLVNTLFNNLIDTFKCPNADEQDVGRIYLDQFLMRMLPSSLRRNIGNRALHDLKQGLLQDVYKRQVLKK